MKIKTECVNCKHEDYYEIPDEFVNSLSAIVFACPSCSCRALAKEIDREAAK